MFRLSLSKYLRRVVLEDIVPVNVNPAALTSLQYCMCTYTTEVYPKLIGKYYEIAVYCKKHFIYI